MYYPYNWSDKSKLHFFNGQIPKNGQWGNNYKVPDDHCTYKSGVPCHSAMFTGRGTDWFTNYTWIPGVASHLPWWKKTPSQAPGVAPIHGNGCGANGGNPYPQGCNAGNGPDPNPYGTQCQWNGGYVGGRSAMEHAAEGLFDNAPVVTWRTDDSAFVFWTSGMKHRGWYSYRLCKVTSF